MSRTAEEITASWTQLDVEAGGVRLHVHRAGRADRPPLVLAHGLGDSGRCWWRVAAALADDADLVMIDARHHGRSSSPDTSETSLSDDVGAVVAALELERPAMMGHSIGARTVAEFAAARPGIVERLVLIDPPWTAVRESDGAVRDAERAAIHGWLESFAGMSDAELAALGRQQHPDWPEAEYPTWIESKRQVSPDAADDVASIGWGSIVAALDCPTLLIYGAPERGGIVTDEVAQRATRLNALITGRRLGGAGHNIHRENFDGFIDVVRRFLLPDTT